jgi:hypothetical protein
MSISRVVTVLSLLVFHPVVKPALAQKSGAEPERFSVKLAIPAGFCGLNPMHPVDGAYIRAIGSDPKKRLLFAAYQCSRLPALRKSPVELQEYELFNLHWAIAKERITTTVEAHPAVLCKTGRKLAGDIDASTPNFEKRLLAARKTMAPGQDQLLGVAAEEPGACYVAVLGARAVPGKELSSSINVRVTVVIKGRLLEFIFSNYTPLDTEAGAYRHSLARAKQFTQQLRAANP